MLKQLLPEFTAQQEFIDLFLREAKLSATLDHANIVHTFDLVDAGRIAFIVMEYVRGGDLRTLAQAARSAPRASGSRRRRRCYITREVLAALAYAHSKPEHRRRAAGAHPPRRLAVEHPLLGRRAR